MFETTKQMRYHEIIPNLDHPPGRIKMIRLAREGPADLAVMAGIKQPGHIQHNVQRIGISFRLWILQELPSGYVKHSYWKWPFIVSFPIKNGDFP